MCLWICCDFFYSSWKIYEKSRLIFLSDIVKLCIEFPQVHSITLCKIVLNYCQSFHHCGQCTRQPINPLCGQSPFEYTNLSAEGRLDLGFGAQKKCPFPLSGGVPLTEATDTKIMWTFFRDQILCPLNGVVPWLEMSKTRRSYQRVMKSCLPMHHGSRPFCQMPCKDSSRNSF